MNELYRNVFLSDNASRSEKKSCSEFLIAVAASTLGLLIIILLSRPRLQKEIETMEFVSQVDVPFD